MKRILLAALVVATSFAVASCGSRSKTTTNVSTTTTGQELSDLKAAYESGAMTAEEYENKRQEILKRKE